MLQVPNERTPTRNFVNKVQKLYKTGNNVMRMCLRQVVDIFERMVGGGAAGIHLIYLSYLVYE